MRLRYLRNQFSTSVSKLLDSQDRELGIDLCLELNFSKIEIRRGEVDWARKEHAKRYVLDRLLRIKMGFVVV